MIIRNARHLGHFEDKRAPNVSGAIKGATDAQGRFVFPVMTNRQGYPLVKRVLVTEYIKRPSPSAVLIGSIT